MKAELSILGLYRYDPHIFDGFRVPEGVSKQDAIDAICLELAELEVIYPRPDVMGEAIGIWARINLPIWDKLAETTRYKYNAIHNYDRTEEHTETESRERTGKDTGKSSSTSSSSAELLNVDTNFTAGFNDAGLTKHDSTDTHQGSSGKALGAVDNSVESVDNETVEHSTKITAYGNIGVTTTQQMIQAEREVVQFSVIEHIVDSFKQRFCLMVY